MYEILVMKELLNIISSSFSNFFSHAGYREEPSVAISSGFDRSVTLIGSGISVLKPYLLSPLADIPDVFIRQRAVRTHALHHILDQDDETFSSYFDAFCVLTSYERFGTLMEDAMTFFTKVLNVESSCVLFRISSADPDLVGQAIRLCEKPTLEFDTKSTEYYRHRYGLDKQHIRGKNLNFAFSSARMAELDIGNIIVLERNNTPFAVELAFGCQTAAMGLYGIPRSIQANMIADVMPLDTVPYRKLADALVVTAHLERENIRSCKQRYPIYLYRKYARAIDFWREYLGIPEEQIRCWKEQYLKLEYGSM